MPALVFITQVAAPVIWRMDWVAKALVRLFGVDPKDELASAFTAEEVAHILAESRKEGLVEEDQYGLLGAALEFSDKDAVDVAVALSDLVTLPLTRPLTTSSGSSPARVLALPAAGPVGGADRLPPPQGRALCRRPERDIAVPAKRVRKLATVQPADEVEEVLATMQRTGSHLARVVDAEGTRHRGRLPRGRHRGAGRRGHRRLPALTAFATTPPTRQLYRVKQEC